MFAKLKFIAIFYINYGILSKTSNEEPIWGTNNCSTTIIFSSHFYLSTFCETFLSGVLSGKRKKYKTYVRAKSIKVKREEKWAKERTNDTRTITTPIVGVYIALEFVVSVTFCVLSTCIAKLLLYKRCWYEILCATWIECLRLAVCSVGVSLILKYHYYFLVFFC